MLQVMPRFDSCDASYSILICKTQHSGRERGVRSTDVQGDARGKCFLAVEPFPSSADILFES